MDHAVRLRALLQQPPLVPNLRQHQQLQVRCMHHAQRYFACKPNAGVPAVPFRSAPLVVVKVDAEMYKIITHNDHFDSWLWLRPGNKVGRINVQAPHKGYTGPRLFKEEVVPTPKLFKPNRAPEVAWEDIETEEARAKADAEAGRTTWVPINEPTTVEPCAVRSLTYSEHATNPMPFNLLPGPPGTNTGEVPVPLWTARMLGSENDPRARAARRKQVIHQRAYDRFKKEGPLVPPKEHVLDFLARRTWPDQKQRLREETFVRSLPSPEKDS